MRANIGSEPDIIFLLEHKSFDDPGVAVQIGRYAVSILNRYLRQAPDPRGLFPSIIPILIYHER